MEVRDANKDAAYFERFIEKKRDEIEKYAAKVEERPESPLPHKTVARCNFELMCALYSAGRPAEELRGPYSMWVEHNMKAIEGGLGGTGRNQYYMMPHLSVGALLGPSGRDRANLEAMSALIGDGDAACDLVAGHMGVSLARSSGGSRWKFYERMAALPGDGERVGYAAQYVRRWWYGGKGSEYWWGFHKRDDGRLLYFGYWAFDVAACLLAWGLDDSPLLGAKHYPADLARLARAGR